MRRVLLLMLAGGVPPALAHPHVLRHTYGSLHMAHPHGELSRLQRLMGHASPETTAVYVHHDHQALEDDDAERLRDSGHVTHERLVVIAARQAPVAGDLRLVLAFFQISQHLGLIANHFELLTNQLMEMDPQETGSPPILARLRRMAIHAGRQLVDAGRALIERDPHGTQAVGRDDDTLDVLNREVFAAVRDLDGPLGTRELGPASDADRPQPGTGG